jgi:hypothetical protein
MRPIAQGPIVADLAACGHRAAWRHPDVSADASVRIDHYVRTALRENLGLKPAVSRYARDAGTPTAASWMPPRDSTRSMT